MRTTVTEDAEGEQIVGRGVRERDVRCQQARNEVSVEPAAPGANHEPFRTRPAAMGASAVDLDRALRLAGELEDEQLEW